MDQSYNQLFDEKDLLEENKFQKIYKGCYKDQPHRRVVVHRFKMDDQFNHGFKDFLDSTLQNKLHIEIIENEIVLVSKYIEGDNISLHLNFSDVSEEERIDYLYDYLHQATAYIGFDTPLFNILIGSSQIVFKEHQLYLKEQIILDRKLNEDMPFSMVAKNIGQIMQRILITNFNELKTSLTYDEMHRFTESLIRREKDYQSFDDLFGDFKAIYFKKKQTKNQTLLGNAHPNNIFMEFVDVDAYEPVANKEVTDEERAVLMGGSYEKPVVDELPVPEPEDIIEPEPEVEPEPIDWSKGPIEESIDLSKLEDASSLEELFVKEKKSAPVPKYEPEKPSKPEPKEDEETPVYGIPKHFKEEIVTPVVKEEPEEEKKPFNFLIPATIFAALLLVVLGFLWIPSLFDKPIVADPPLAMFEVEIKNNTLYCTNKSEAFGGLTIKESYWEVSKDDVVLKEIPGQGNANFEASGLSPGTYKIKLTVIDSNGVSSDPHVIEKEYQSPESKALENQIQTQNELASTQSFKSASTDEKMDLYEISTTVNVVEDTSMQNKGTMSYKLNLQGTENFASMSFDPLKVPKGATISFMIMTNQAKPITIQLLGYDNGKNVYNKEMISDKGTVLDWTALSVQMSGTSDLDKLVIRFEAEDTIVWFDELSIRTFK